MEINKEIKKILEQNNINVGSGTLYLLGVYHELDVHLIVPSDIIHQVNLTKIVEKDFETDTIKWNIPIYSGQQTAFDWVSDWIIPFGRMNPERKGSVRDCVARMKFFFQQNPEYRKDDVYAARDAYLASVKDPKYLKSSHKFIYEGSGTHRTFPLLQWCEKLKESVDSRGVNIHMRGKVV